MKRFKNILYVVEQTADQISALARAVSLAENNQAQLKIISVIPFVADEYGTDSRDYHMKSLESLIEPFRHRTDIRYEVLMGTVFLEVIRAVLRNGHDLVIKIAENAAFMKRLFGSDDMHLLRKCPCPLWLMKTQDKSNYSCILAAVDFDPLKTDEVQQALNRNILELAGSLALSDFAALHLIHTWEAFAESVMRARSDVKPESLFAYDEKERLLHQQGLNMLSATLRDRIGTDAYNYISPSLHLLKGPARKMIPESAVKLNADLVVMGTVARTGIPGLIIGNTAEAILGQLRCSVLAVKPPGFTVPVKLGE
jgi:nucleotide-binding universal stress UspA family protein